MISLFELAEYNAFKKNYAKPLTKTHKDILAFIALMDYFLFLYYRDSYFNDLEQPFFMYVNSICNSNLHKRY